ncbi:MAG: mechanosensitive ion channel family protein, partial [candidate division Zixibacteria bacterium]|nr:mechanosensitive ion channel family protein [candidate division Zixibacteria bacterium]
SRTKWDDILAERKVFDRLSHIAPALVIYYMANIFPAGQETIERVAIIYIILAGVLVYDSFLNAILEIYRNYEISKQKPIKGYIQVVKIITYIFVIIFVIATLMDRSPLVLLSGLGAMTAILMLIFKDSILGLVAGIQLSFNDMIRIDDWIEMPAFGADGDVIDITLNTVKVQNWDKTISTIPAYAMISNSFKNWRGMSESGGRRIKRSFNIDMNSIKFCNEEMINRFKKIQYITEYIERKKEELALYNKERSNDNSLLINGRHMTNVGTFRAYIQAYLRNHPKIHKEMTFLVRQLKPTETGLPIEIYVFSNDQNWINYEGIQADIFDHLFAVAPEFELRLFQSPSGNDFSSLNKTVN